MLYSDYTTTLTHLMKYPPNSDVNLIIRHALHIKVPKKYPRPANVFVFVTGKQPAPIRRPDGNRSSPKRLSGPAQLPPPRRRSNPTPDPSRVNGLHAQTAKQALTIAAASHNLDTEAGIVDGYTEDDPEVYKLELQHAYNIMSLSRTKLFEYVNIMRKNLPHNSKDELYQAVDGLEELCSLLKPKQQCVFNVPAPVEPAFEADESPKKGVNSPKSPPPARPDFPIQRTARPPVGVRPKEVEMKVIRIKTWDINLNGWPTIDPVMERRSSY